MKKYISILIATLLTTPVLADGIQFCVNGKDMRTGQYCNDNDWWNRGPIPTRQVLNGDHAFEPLRRTSPHSVYDVRILDNGDSFWVLKVDRNIYHCRVTANGAGATCFPFH